MSIDDNIWYAVNQTRVVTEPKSTLETFGVTRIKYFIVCEQLDSVNKVERNYLQLNSHNTASDSREDKLEHIRDLTGVLQGYGYATGWMNRV